MAETGLTLRRKERDVKKCPTCHQTIPEPVGYKMGGHYYPDPDGTSDCANGCGCWMEPYRSGGPDGVDPFGKCPNEPKPAP